MAENKRYRNIAQLNERISLLRKKSKEDEKSIRDAVHDIRNDLRPGNLIKNGLTSLLKEKESGKNALNTAAGILLDFLLTRYLGKKSGSALSGIIRDAGLTEAAAGKADQLIETGTEIIRQVFGRRRKENREEHSEQEE